MISDQERRDIAEGLRDLEGQCVPLAYVLDELGMDCDGADVPKAHVERLADLIDRPTWRSIAKEAAMRMLGMFTIALAIVTASGMLAGLVQLAAAVIGG